VTLLSLALDPFTQQVIQLREDLVFAPIKRLSANAQIGASAYYQDGDIILDNSTQLTNGTHVSTYQTSTPPYMQAAVLAGLTTAMNKLQAQVPYTCPTAECRWPVYNSLAVCTRCSNTTSQITRIPGNSIDLYRAFASQYGGHDILGENATVFRLPTGQFIANMDGFMETRTGPNGAPNSVMSASGTGIPGKTLSLQDIDTLIWSTNILAINPPRNKLNQTTPIGGKWPDMPLISYECGLYWCVNQYESVVRNNTLSEHVTELQATVEMPKGDSFSWPFQALQFNRTVLGSGIWPSGIGLCGPKREGNYRCFNVTVGAVLSLNNYFQTLLTTGSSLTNDTVGLGPNTLHNKGGLVAGRSVPTALGGIWTTGKPDLQATFDALARSMTNAVRGSANGADGTVSSVPGSAQGVSGITQTVFRMQWEWMALHCTVFVLAIAFLLLTITHPGRNRAPLWKSSALAILTTGENAAEALRGAKTMQQIRERAKKVEVVLFDAAETGQDREQGADQQLLQSAADTSQSMVSV
jgi:hypothetical protein